MTYGAIKAGDTHYCLFPRDRSQVQEIPYVPDGPFANSAEADPVSRELISPLNRPMPNTRAVLEDEIWCEGGLLVAIAAGPERLLPICPVRLEFFGMPVPLLKEVLPKISVVFEHDQALAQLDWGGIVCNRAFKVVMLPVGVAAWPPKELPGWTTYYLLMALGGINHQTVMPPFQRFEPVAFSLSEPLPSVLVRNPLAAQVRVYDERFIAMAKASAPPRLIGFCDQKAKNGSPLGVSFLGPSSDGLSFMTAEAWAEEVLEAHEEPLRTEAQSLRVAFDFGTSNTSIAVARDQGLPALLRFTESSCARVLTARQDLDPYRFENTRLRFFPCKVPYSNPLPTILLEITRIDSHALSFDGSQGLPARLIPPPDKTFDASVAQQWASNGMLRQDFKWQGGERGDQLRKGFLELLAQLVSYQLRCDLGAVPQRIGLIGTYPLAYSSAQHNDLVTAFEIVADEFRRAGFTTTELAPFLSESFANFRFVSRTATSLHGTDTGRVVVVDIGGGTTDISVFTEKGTVCFMDSLLIGGRDIASSLLPYRMLRQDRAQQVLQALELRSGPAGSSDVSWCDGVQYILIQRMKTRGVKDLANSLRNAGMVDLTGEILGLLAFATVYGVKMALQPDPQAVQRLNITFCGLGSQLFGLAPIVAPEADAWASAQKVLQRIIAAFPESQHLASKIRISRISDAKEAVCLGAALPRSGNGDATLKTLWWSNFRRTRPSPDIAWNLEFDLDTARLLSDPEIDNADAAPLLEVTENVIGEVGRATFDRGWRPNQDELSRIRQDVPASYRHGCTRIKADDDSSPPHPVRQVTEALKEMLCATIER